MQIEPYALLSCVIAVVIAVPIPQTTNELGAEIAPPPGFPPLPPDIVYVRLDDNGFDPSYLEVASGTIVIFGIEGSNAHGITQTLGGSCQALPGGLTFGPEFNPT